MFCPSITGGKNWEPTSYNPQLGTIYVPSNEGCSGMRTVTAVTPFEGKLNGTTKKRSSWTGGGVLNAQQLIDRNLTDTRPIQTAGNSLNVIDVTNGEVKTKIMVKAKVWGTVSTAVVERRTGRDQDMLTTWILSSWRVPGGTVWPTTT